MTPSEAREILAEAFLDVAPDSDPTTIASDAAYREALGIDSMDFLEILELVATRTGVEVPESDYGAIETMDAFATYLVGHA